MKKLLALSLVVLSSLSCNRDRVGYVAPVVNPTNTYDNRSVGLSSNDFLALAKYKAINLEICYVEEHALPQSVINNAVAFLEKYCHKPGGIHVYQQEIGRQGGKLYVNDLVNIEDDFRTRYEHGDTLGLYILVTEADFNEEGVLGVAYKNTSVAVFDGIITENAGGEGRPSRVTALSTVLHHELGHLLGLVNAGAPLQSAHHDAAHGKHCTNTKCLMHYQMQTTALFNILGGDFIPVLDADCELDLKANGSR